MKIRNNYIFASIASNETLPVAKNSFCSQAVAAHTFNPSIWEAEAGGFLSSRPAWSTE
jgi:major histocompatibility complex class I